MSRKQCELNRKLAALRDEADSEEEFNHYRDRLVEENIGLVGKIVWSKFQNQKPEVRDDLLAEGYLILVEKATDWNPTLGTFSTYCYPAITGAMIKHLREFSYPVRYTWRQFEKGKRPPTGVSWAEYFIE